jgi:hypothetical protein
MLRTAYLIARMCTLDVEPVISAEQLAPIALRAVNAAAHHRHALGIVGRSSNSYSYK